MNNLLIIIISLLFILSSFVSCGTSKSGDQETAEISQTTLEDSIDGSKIDGLYMAKFETLNPHINGTLPGSLTLNRSGDRLLTYVRLFAGKTRAKHQQGIYLGRRCPTLLDDKNGDGILDITEARAVAGSMIIPLDGNLNTQSAGKNIYPRGDLSGYYHYERISSFNSLFNDLRGTDSNLEDGIAKLGTNDLFGFLGRVIIVQGVTEDTELPESVATEGDLTSYESLPITCGIIGKNGPPPGSSYNDEIPGPVADVTEGQDQPAPGPIQFPGRRIIVDTTGGSTGESGSTTGGSTGETGSTTGGSTGETGSTTGGSTGETGSTTGDSTGDSTGETTGGAFF